MKRHRFWALLLSMCMILSFGACSSNENNETADNSNLPADNSSTEDTQETPTPDTPDPVTVNIGMLKGPTGIGSVYLLSNSDAGTTQNDYNFILGSAPTEFTSALINGDLDIAALPTNVAATLYNKTEGEITLLALNTLGVLYILENGNSINSLSDLRGRTLYATGQGSNPQYVLEYLLRQNGLEPGTDVIIEYLESDELATRMASGDIDLCMLPVPNATSVLIQNTDVRSAIDLTAEWDALDNGSVLTMGCVVVRNDFLAEHKDAVDIFLTEYYNSISKVLEQSDDVYELIASYELVGNEQVARAALSDCNLTYIVGSNLEPSISGYYQVLFDANPDSIGGQMPAEDFYYVDYANENTQA